MQALRDSDSVLDKTFKWYKVAKKITGLYHLKRFRGTEFTFFQSVRSRYIICNIDSYPKTN